MSRFTKEDLFKYEKSWSGLHDVIVDVVHITPTKELAENIFDGLPSRVKELAYKSGLNDTYFREEAFDAIEQEVDHDRE